MLYLACQPFAHAREAELRLSRRQNGCPTVGREKAVEEERHLSARQRENRWRYELLVSVAAPEAELLQPLRERVGYPAVDRRVTGGSQRLRLGPERGAQIRESVG